MYVYMYVYVYYDIAGVGVMTVYTEDVDAGHNRTVVYSLKQVPMFGTHKIFSIDRNTGLISTNYAEALDREREAVYRDVIVQARDNGIPTPLFCKPKLLFWRLHVHVYNHGHKWFSPQPPPRSRSK